MGGTDTVAPNQFAIRFEAQLVRIESEPVGRWLVAYSGGIDSSVLLHSLKGARGAAQILAIHFDHGLQPQSGQWSAHCAGQAAALGIEFVEAELRLTEKPGRSLEASAREARYAELAKLTRPGDVVVTAHHADDQLETVLLRLLRGSGVRGLTAIHSVSCCGKGRLARPLLEFSRPEIETEARRIGLEWLDDPSNMDTRFDRNFLRHECLPRLRARWPRAGRVASRLARQMGEAEAVLEEIAIDDLGGDVDAARIPLELLGGLSEPRLNNALRHAVRSLGLPVPDARQLAELRKALSARDDAESRVCWPGAEGRVYQRQLYLMAPIEAFELEGGKVGAEGSWQFAAGELRLEETDDYGIPDRWARQGIGVHFRRGGERFRPYGSKHSKRLKQWFQDAGIVPWMRAAVPLLSCDERIIAVADLVLADGLPQGADDGPFWRPVWTGHAPLH